MRARRAHPALLILNAGLAVVLAAVALAPRADAQRAARARGDYTMVSGRTQGGSSNHAVYIIDASNQEVVALRWNDNTRGLEGLGYRDLAADAQANPGR